MQTATTECAEVREALPAYVRDGEVGLAVRRHVGQCTDCKRELGRYVALLAGLDDLRHESIEPPAGLLASLVTIPSEQSRVETVRSHVVRNKRVYAGGVAVAAMGLAGAVAPQEQALQARHRLTVDFAP